MIDFYLDDLADAIAAELGWPGLRTRSMRRSPFVASDRHLLRLYALLGVVKGSEVSREDVHDAGAVWWVTTRPYGGSYPEGSLVRFNDLSPEEQALDERYVQAIRRAIKRLT